MNNVLVLLNYNDVETTLDFIKRHKDSRYIDKIIVVDNNSTDNSFNELVRIKDEKILVRKAPKNGGYAYGNNFGAKIGIELFHPRYITIANPDTVIEDDAFNAIFDVYKVKNNAAIVSCLMKSSYLSKTLTAWRQPSILSSCIACLFGLKKLFKGLIRYPDRLLKKEAGKICNVDVIAGSFFVIPSKIYEDINGFDEHTFLYFEEAILSKKVKNCGYSNYINCGYEYLHEHSVSINKSYKSSLKRLDLLQNSRKYYCKEYLKASRMQLLCLDVCYLIGKIEYKLYLLLKAEKQF